MRQEDVKELLKKYSEGTANAEEKALVEAWYAHFDTGEQIITEAHLQSIEDEVLKRLPVNREITERRLWPRIAAAASILLLLSAGGYFIFHHQKSSPAFAAVKPGTFKNDAVPGNKAILTLGNGQQLALNTLPAGPVANAHAQKTSGGKLVYDQSADASVEYNMLTVPRGGGKHELRLADGTLVVLDAGSSIRFPTAFPGKDRQVTISGQVYFEVVHSVKQPFYVHVGDQTIADIGTAFNVNAFDGEIRTTLLEGSVKVDQILLKPGQQAWHHGKATNLLNDIDKDAVIAWKNNMFKFSGDATVQTVMNQLSRWYDMEIVYQGQEKADHHFGGEMPRYAKLSDVLKILAYSGVQFSVDGKKIIVYQ